MQPTPYPQHFIHLAIWTAAVLVFLLAYDFIHTNEKQQVEKTQSLIVQEATAHYQTIKNTHIWHEKLGGVFKATSDKDKYFFNIYSVNPQNPVNKATGYAAEALRYFDLNRAEDIAYRFSANHRDFEFVGVLHAQAECLPCHSAYRTGDVRGGIQINLPLDNYRDGVAAIEEQFRLFAAITLLFIVLSASLLSYFVRSMFKHQKRIMEVNASLERRVAERTKEVNLLYTREHYLRDLLSTISEINESLINTYSMGSIIESSIEKLKHHPNYRLILFSHFDGAKCHLRHIIGDHYQLLRETVYDLPELQSEPLLRSTAEAIVSRHWELDAGFDSQSIASFQKRARDYTLTESVAFPLIDDDRDANFEVLTFWTDRQEGFDQEEIRILDSVATDITMALSAYKQRQLSESLYLENIKNYEETILAFVDMIEQRDAYTAGHTLRVAQYSRRIAEQMGMEDSQIRRLERAAILHDIGKIATPDTILLKPGKLSGLEYNLIQNHVMAGYKMLSKVKMYADLAEIIQFHHERYDGKGYPKGYKGEEIPKEAQIMIVADAFDAMTTNRIYKGRLSIPDALGELRKNSGTQFHPDVVEATLTCLSTITVNETTQLPKNELERQRFSYFFNDTLTGFFNVAYLQLLLHRDDSFYCANIVELKRFTKFNKVAGWNKGNELLISVANQLKKGFPESILFRYHGDDFLILSSTHVEFDVACIDIRTIDEDSIVKIQNSHLDMREHTDRDVLGERLELGKQA